MSNFTHGIEISFGAINDVERSIFANYKESKNIFQLVFIRSIFGQCCNTHQIDINKPVTEGLVLRFHFAATNSISQQCSMHYIDRCVGTYIGLLFVITDRGPSKCYAIIQVLEKRTENCFQMSCDQFRFLGSIFNDSAWQLFQCFGWTTKSC